MIQQPLSVFHSTRSIHRLAATAATFARPRATFVSERSGGLDVRSSRPNRRDLNNVTNFYLPK